MVKTYNPIKMQKMRFSNDCSLASVAMVTRIPYQRVLKVALSRGFKPNGRYGARIGELLIDLDIDFDVRVYIPIKNERARRPIPVRGAWIVSIPSLNNRGGYHAVVVCNGVVFDPSNKRRASINYIMRNRRHIYYGFKPDV